MKKVTSLFLSAALLATSASTVFAEDINTIGKSTDFTFMVSNSITHGYYNDYDSNPVAQWWLDQEWDADGDGEGTKLTIDFWAPTAGAEQDYVNTLISTEEYPDVLPLVFSSEGASVLYNEEMILDLTAFVDAYMPNYKAFMEAHPEYHYTNKVDGEEKILQLYFVNEDITPFPWGGFFYRRDWLVNFGTNPETGEAFSGEWADGEWSDNVVFPSGNTDPVYISDWEWMFGIFETALEAQGMADGYAVQLPYQGMYSSGDLISGFNSGVYFRYDADGKIICDTGSEGMRAYVECVANWYKNGWVDSAFAERAGDMFFMIDMASVYSGQVGLWYGLDSQELDGLAGDGSNPWTAGAVVFPAANPINDVYGPKSCQNVEPTVFYQDALLSQAFVITDKAAKKDIATLLTAIDYFYSAEGSVVFSYGLTNEMMAATEGTSYNDFYKELGLEDGAVIIDGDTYVLNPIIPNDVDVNEAAAGKRLLGMTKINNIDRGYSQTKVKCAEQLTKYVSTGSVQIDVTGQLAPSDLKKYNAYITAADTCIAQMIPGFIRGEVDVTDDAEWEKFTNEIQAMNPDEVVTALNAVIE